MTGCNDYDYINKPKPDLEFVYRLARQIEALQFEIGLREMARDGCVEKIKQYEEITGIQSSQLPKFGGSLEALKARLKGKTPLEPAGCIPKCPNGEGHIIAHGMIDGKYHIGCFSCTYPPVNERTKELAIEKFSGIKRKLTNKGE